MAFANAQLVQEFAANVTKDATNILKGAKSRAKKGRFPVTAHFNGYPYYDEGQKRTFTSFAPNAPKSGSSATGGKWYKLDLEATMIKTIPGENVRVTEDGYDILCTVTFSKDGQNSVDARQVILNNLNADPATLHPSVVEIINKFTIVREDGTRHLKELSWEHVATPARIDVSVFSFNQETYSIFSKLNPRGGGRVVSEMTPLMLEDCTAQVYIKAYWHTYKIKGPDGKQIDDPNKARELRMGAETSFTCNAGVSLVNDADALIDIVKIVKSIYVDNKPVPRPCKPIQQVRDGTAIMPQSTYFYVPAPVWVSPDQNLMRVLVPATEQEFLANLGKSDGSRVTIKRDFALEDKYGFEDGHIEPYRNVITVKEDVCMRVGIDPDTRSWSQLLQHNVLVSHLVVKYWLSMSLDMRANQPGVIETRGQNDPLGVHQWVSFVCRL
jgi:hypothetical protein